MPDINEIEQRLLKVEQVLKVKGWLNEQPVNTDPPIVEFDRDPITAARIRNENG